MKTKTYTKVHTVHAISEGGQRGPALHSYKSLKRAFKKCQQLAQQNIGQEFGTLSPSY